MEPGGRLRATKQSQNGHKSKIPDDRWVNYS